MSTRGARLICDDHPGPVHVLADGRARQVPSPAGEAYHIQGGAVGTPRDYVLCGDVGEGEGPAGQAAVDARDADVQVDALPEGDGEWNREILR